jgi:hypothetical protein
MGYWQVPLWESDKEKTTFLTPDSLFEFNVLPMGLSNAPGTLYIAHPCSSRQPVTTGSRRYEHCVRVRVRVRVRLRDRGGIGVRNGWCQALILASMWCWGGTVKSKCAQEGMANGLVAGRVGRAREVNDWLYGPEGAVDHGVGTGDRGSGSSPARHCRGPTQIRTRTRRGARPRGRARCRMSGPGPRALGKAVSPKH